MEPTTNNLNLQSLRDDIRRPLQDFAESILARLASRIESISVVGSSLTADFVSGISDINTVIVFRRDLVGSLDDIAAMGRGLHKKRIAPPLLLSPDYLRKSRDTFPIELLDFQLNHCTIFGEDPFTSLSFTKKDVRLQCERELRSILFRLSQGYVVCGAGAKPVAQLLVSSVTGMTSLLRAMLWLKDIDRSGSFEQVFTKSAIAFSFDPATLIEIRKWKSSHRLPSKDVVAQMFAACHELVSHLTSSIDTIEV